MKRRQRRPLLVRPETSAVTAGYAGMGDTSHYGASVTRKQLSNWNPIKAPADADLLPDLSALVARARDLNRNNGVAAGAFQTLQDNVVGLGLRLAAAPNWRALGKSVEWAEEWTRNVESLWQTYAESFACDAAGKLTFSGMTALVWRSVLENGEALALPLWLNRQETEYKTCIQIVDTDRLSNPSNLPTSKKLRGGIEMDDFGRPLAYHIRQINDWVSFYVPVWGGNYTWERIPAMTGWGRPRVLHIHQQDRADQTRGKPILTPVIEQFRMLDSYQRTELQSAIVNALVAGVIETPMDSQGIAEMMGSDPAAYLDQKNGYRVQLEGGTFIPLWPGDKLTPYTPSRPPGTFPSFVEAITRQIGSACGLPYELVAKDFSKVTYASARAALSEAWRFFENRRRWMSDNWASRVYALWLEEAIDHGDVEAPDFEEHRAYYSRAKWIGPGRNQIDPVKEAQATQLRLLNQTSTLEIECAEAGLDWNDVLEQLALEAERKKQLNLTPPPLLPGQTPGAAPNPAQDPSGDGEDTQDGDGETKPPKRKPAQEDQAA
jgi:lambda family phage portal protein